MLFGGVRVHGRPGRGGDGRARPATRPHGTRRREARRARRAPRGPGHDLRRRRGPHLAHGADPRRRRAGEHGRAVPQAGLGRHPRRRRRRRDLPRLGGRAAVHPQRVRVVRARGGSHRRRTAHGLRPRLRARRARRRAGLAGRGPGGRAGRRRLLRHGPAAAVLRRHAALGARASRWSRGSRSAAAACVPSRPARGCGRSPSTAGRGRE